MTDLRITTKNAALAIVAAAAVAAALYLLLWAAFPYIYAESGSSRYARDHRVEAIGQAVAAIALFFIAWQCIRRSFSGRTWGVIGAVALAAFLFSSLANYWKRPENVRPVGGNWYVRPVPQPREIDTVYYSVFYRHGAHFEPVEDLASEYRFVPPDCLVYRGLKVSGRPMFAMCGYRAPIESYDTTRTEAELLAMAHINPAYGNPGRVIR